MRTCSMLIFRGVTGKGPELQKCICLDILSWGNLFLEHCDWKGLRNQIVGSLLVAILTWKEHHNTTYSPEKCWCHPYSKKRILIGKTFQPEHCTNHQPPYPRSIGWKIVTGVKKIHPTAPTGCEKPISTQGRNLQIVPPQKSCCLVFFLVEGLESCNPQYEKSSSSSQSPDQMSELIPIANSNKKDPFSEIPFGNFW